jgi:hypothetical protein
MSLMLATFAVFAVAPPAQAAVIQVGHEKWSIDPVGATPSRGTVEIFVYSDHRKHLIICDRLGADGALGIQVDPSGVAAPLFYPDANGSNAGCGVYDIWYSVRKYRFALRVGTTIVVQGLWHHGALPHPDF